LFAGIGAGDVGRKTTGKRKTENALLKEGAIVREKREGSSAPAAIMRRTRRACHGNTSPFEKAWEGFSSCFSAGKRLRKQPGAYALGTLLRGAVSIVIWSPDDRKTSSSMAIPRRGAKR